MATRLYWHAATDSTTGLPTTEQSSLTSTLRADALTLNRSMNITIGTADVTIELVDPASNQSAVPAYFSRWVSPPLNQTSIAANTWTVNFATQDHSSAGEKYPVDGTAPARINLYVWRPSNSTKVGTVVDGNTGNINNNDNHPDFFVHNTTISGAAVSSVQANDVLICELWLPAVDMEAGEVPAFSLNFDGTTANTTNDANITSNPNHASFLQTPENLTFSTGTTTVSQTSIHKYNLKQNIAQTSIQKYNIAGTTTTVTQTSIQKYNLRQNLAQTSIQKYSLRSNTAQTSIQKYNLRQYLAQTSVQKYNINVTAGGPTRLYFHAATSSVSGTLPTTEQSSRTSSHDTDPQSTNRSMNTTIGTGQTSVSGTTGVTSLLDIYWTKFVSDPLNVTSIAANTWTYNFAYISTDTNANWPAATGSPGYVNCYVWRPSNGTKVGTILDGTTTTLTEAIGAQTVQHKTFTGAAVSSIQTGDVIIIEIWWRVSSTASGSTSTVSWYYDGTTVNTTNNSQTGTNHASFIETPEGITFSAGTTTVSQTSIHKYNLKQLIPQTSIQKYHIRNFVAITTSIQKYNLRRLVAVTTSIQKYSLRALVAITTSIQKYKLGGMVLQQSTHKYNIISAIGPINMDPTSTKTYSNKFITKV